MQNLKRVINTDYKNHNLEFVTAKDKFCALTSASKNLHLDLPKILLHKYQNKKTILHLTCEVGNAIFLEEIMNLVSIANIAPKFIQDFVNQKDRDSYSALYYGLLNHSDFDVIEIMLKAGAKIGYDEIYAILSCINEARHIISTDIMYQILVLIINKNSQYLTREHISNISSLNLHPSVLKLVSKVNTRIYREQKLEYLYEIIVASYNAAKKNVASNKKVNEDLIFRVFDYFASNDTASKEIVDFILSGEKLKLKSFINNLTSGFIDIMTTKTTSTKAKKAPVKKKPLTAKKVGLKKVGLKKVTATKKPAAKKAVAKKVTAKKAVAKKTMVKKPVAKKTTAKKVVAKKTVAKKPMVKKAAVKKAVTKKTMVKKAAAKKVTAKKAVKKVAKKAVAKKTTAKKSMVKKAAVKKAAKKPMMKKSAVKKTAKKATKKTAKKAGAKTLSQAVSKFVSGNKSLINKTMGKTQLVQLASLLVGLLGDSKISGSLNKANVQAIIDAAAHVAKGHVAHKTASLKKRA